MLQSHSTQDSPTGAAPEPLRAISAGVLVLTEPADACGGLRNAASVKGALAVALVA